MNAMCVDPQFLAAGFYFKNRRFCDREEKAKERGTLYPHLTFDPEDYIGYAIRFWKEQCSLQGQNLNCLT